MNDYIRVMRRRDQRRRMQTICLGFAVALTITVLLAGCEAQKNTEKTIITYGEPGPSYYVHEVKLKDDTRCVVATSFSADGGVSIVCNWRERQ